MPYLRCQLSELATIKSASAIGLLLNAYAAASALADLNRDPLHGRLSAGVGPQLPL